MAWLKDTCDEIERCEARDSSRRLDKKFSHLSSRQQTPRCGNKNAAPPTEDTEHRRVNILSKQSLPAATKSLLGKGPQFALTQQVTTATLRTVELGVERLAYTIRCRKLRASEPNQDTCTLESDSETLDSADETTLRLRPPFKDLDKRQPDLSDGDTEGTLARLKEDIMSIYVSACKKRVKPNTTIEERRALKELRSNPRIIVKPSDKCKGFVVLDRESYIEKARAILDDPEGYEKLRRDPTRQVEKTMTKLWRKVATDKVPQRNLYMLIARHSQCAEWYGLPKDHKSLIPLRPIVSTCDTPCERVS